MFFVGYALITKIKTLHANDLKKEDFEELLKKRSIYDVAVFLKKHPAYHDILANESESSLNRSRLEGLIKRQKFNQMMKLVKFLHLNDQPFYAITLVKMEHEVILEVIRSFISHDEYDVVEQIPYYFDRYSKIDFLALTKTKNIAQLVEVLSNTRYAALLQPYVKVSNDMIRYYEFEALFEKDYYHYAFEQIKAHYHGKVKKDLQDAFKARIEMESIIKVYRLKKFYGIGDSDIKSILIPSTRISDKKIDEIIAIKNPEDILKVIVASGIGPYINDKNEVYLEYYDDYMRFTIAQRFMYFSTKAPTVYLAYVFLSELEEQNLTHIIEGIRYQVSESEIRPMLVF